MQAFLVADAGSSKTSWSIIIPGNQSAPIRFTTKGINPAHLNLSQISETIIPLQKAIENYKIEEIHFFGAGCATTELKEKVATALKIFDANKIEVDSDLTGAALALFGDGQGLACILGTGANTGLFNEGKCINHIPPLGYILGDEGSGAALGKDLINAVFKKSLSDRLIEKFHQTYKLTLSDLIDKVYRQPGAPAFLASFVPFLSENILEEEIRELISNQFTQFFKKNVIPYNLMKNTQVGFVGSIAYHFSPQLIETAKKFELEISNIQKQPMDMLEKYYLNNQRII